MRGAGLLHLPRGCVLSTALSSLQQETGFPSLSSPVLHHPCSHRPAPSKPCSSSLERGLKEKRGRDALRLLSAPKKMDGEVICCKNSWEGKGKTNRPLLTASQPASQPGFGDSGDTAPAPPQVCGWRCRTAPHAKNVACHLPPRPLLSPGGLSPDNPGGKPVWRSRWTQARRLSSSAPTSYTQPFFHRHGLHSSSSQPREQPPFPAGIIPPQVPDASRTPWSCPDAPSSSSWLFGLGRGSSVTLKREAFKKGR